MIRKEIYLSFLLSILLFVSIDILSYNHIIIGKEDSNDDNKREGGEMEEAEEAEDFEDITIKELFDDDNEDNIKEEKEEEDDVPFRLPFRAVPFP
ncbi:MAG TPA: hypothetical protein VLA48_07300 [Nitrososphaeraceae archaeon]|nr:hypothetical protein [Nitrososphaeraceae archaeon]